MPFPHPHPSAAPAPPPFPSHSAAGSTSPPWPPRPPQPRPSLRTAAGRYEVAARPWTADDVAGLGHVDPPTRPSALKTGRRSPSALHSPRSRPFLSFACPLLISAVFPERRRSSCRTLRALFLLRVLALRPLTFPNSRSLSFPRSRRSLALHSSSRPSSSPTSKPMARASSGRRAGPARAAASPFARSTWRSPPPRPSPGRPPASTSVLLLAPAPPSFRANTHALCARNSLTPQARSLVHEYGGVAFLPYRSGLLFVNFADQQLYRQSAPDAVPTRITTGDTARRFIAPVADPAR